MVCIECLNGHFRSIVEAEFGRIINCLAVLQLSDLSNWMQLNKPTVVHILKREYTCVSTGWVSSVSILIKFESSQMNHCIGRSYPSDKYGRDLISWFYGGEIDECRGGAWLVSRGSTVTIRKINL